MRSSYLYSSGLTFAKGPKQPPPPTRVSDNLRSEDTVEVLLGLGEGPWSKLHDGLKSFFIANTPLQASDGTLNFPDAQLIFHKGTQMPDPIKFVLGGSAAGRAVNVNLSQDTPVVRTTTTGQLDAIDVRLRIDQLLKTTEEGDVLNEDLVFKIEVKPTSSGTWTNLPSNTGWVRSSPSVGNRQYFGSIDLRVDELIADGVIQATAENQAWQEYQDNADGPVDSSLGRQAYSESIRIYGKTQSPVYKEIRVPVERLESDTYDIRVTKISAETTTDSVRELTWDTFEEIVIEETAYPNTAMAQLIVKASDQLSSVPQMYGIYDTTEVLVPTIFDPETRSYDFSGGVWDGTFKKAFTDDLAWIIYDIIHNDVHGIAAYYPIAFSRYEALEASLYWNACNPVTGAYEGVPRPNGGTRPRVTFNGMIDTPRNSMELLTYMAGAGNAVFYEDAEGVFRLRIEQDSAAVHTFNNMDVENGRFQYSFTDVNTRYNDITVVYRNNKLPIYQEDRRRIHDQNDIDTHGRKPLTFIAVGCVDTDEAIARAYSKLISALTEKRQVTFVTSRFGAYVEPHDIILLSDEAMSEGQSRRSISLDGTRQLITLDRPMSLEPNVNDYMLYVQTVDGIQTFTVDKANSDVNTIAVTSALPVGLPDYFSFTVASASDGNVKPYRAISIKEKGAEKIEISAVEVNRSKYTLIDNFDGSSFDVTEEVVRSDDSFVGNLQAVVTERATSDGKVKDINLTWDAPSQTLAGAIYVVRYSYNDEIATEIYRGPSLQFLHENVPLGTHLYSVSTVDIDGKESPQAARVRVTTTASSYGLPSVTAINIQNRKDSDDTFVGKNLTLTWDVDTDTEQWEGWAVDLPHPDFEKYVINIIDRSDDSIVHTYEVTDWKVRNIEILFSELTTFGLSNIRDYNVSVHVEDADTNPGASLIKRIQKPIISITPVTLEQVDNITGNSKLVFTRPDDIDYRGVRVTQNSEILFQGDAVPYFPLEDGNQSIQYQFYDVFGFDGYPELTAALEVNRRSITDEVDTLITDLANNTSSVADLVAQYGDTTAVQDAITIANGNLQLANEILALQNASVVRESLEVAIAGGSSSRNAALEANNYGFEDGLTGWGSKPGVVISNEIFPRMEVWSLAEEGSENTTYEKEQSFALAEKVLTGEEAIRAILNE